MATLQNVQRYSVEFDGVLCDSNTDQPVSDRQEIEGIVARIMRELTKLSATNPSVTGQPESAAIQISVAVEESDPFLASASGFTQIRTAVHAAGVGTPKWKVEWVRTTTERATTPA